MASQGEELDERLLIERAQQDRSCFADLYEIFFDRIYAYVARRVNNREEAEDLTSDVFHHALANLSRFEFRGAPFAAWLYRMAANAVADRFERLERERGLDAPVEVSQADQEEAQDQARVIALVRELPEDQRRVVELRFGEQKSIREVAEELGRSEGAIKQLQFRGLEALRARMGGQHG